MESENGVAFGDESCAIVEKHLEGSLPELNIEGNNVDANTEFPTINGVSKSVSKDEGINSSGGAGEVAATVRPGKNSKTKKDDPKSAVSKAKLTKDKPNLKGATPVSRIQRAILSQSLSFPARGAHVDAMKKSIDVYPVKTEVKNTRANATKTEAPYPSFHLNHLNRRALSSGVHSTDEKKAGGASVRRTTLATIPNVKSSTSRKSGSMNKPASNSSDVTGLVDQSLSAVKTALPIKEDDDAQSIASSTTTPGGRRSGASGFSFRLDERAEKRKEFFTKLEEKIQAKEAEKNNSQAKSKEHQEAEIKQLRKSLTFKAAPMPSFYKEPPPKIEMKKIPTTRPISPKLGRHKISIPSLTSPSEGGGTCLSPCLNRGQNNSNKESKAKSKKDVAESKKPIRKSQHRLHSQENGAAKAEGKPGKSQAKADTKDEKDRLKACAEVTEESQDQSGHLSECKDKVEPELSADQSKEPVTIAAPAPETMPQEVTIAVPAPENMPREVIVGN